MTIVAIADLCYSKLGLDLLSWVHSEISSDICHSGKHTYFEPVVGIKVVVWSNLCHGDKATGDSRFQTTPITDLTFQGPNHVP